MPAFERSGTGTVHRSVAVEIEVALATVLLFSGSVVSESLQPHGLQHSRRPCPSLSPSLLKLMSIESLMPSNHLILSLPLLLLPSIFPSIRVFSSESVLYIRWPKYWSFGFDISPSSEYSGLIPFRIVWFDPVNWHYPGLFWMLGVRGRCHR